MTGHRVSEKEDMNSEVTKIINQVEEIKIS